jgi:dipicolinate synthase subunit A
VTTISDPAAWINDTIAVIGGDEREVALAEAAATTGARVRTYGFPRAEMPPRGCESARSEIEAATDASILVLPLPGMTGERVFAPRTPVPVIINAEVLGALAQNAIVVSGDAKPELAQLVTAAGRRLVVYEHDRIGRAARAGAVAEGAIARIVQETPFTIDGSRAALLGYGVVGTRVAAGLRALGAEVTVCVRSSAQRGEAIMARHKALDVVELTKHLREFDFVLTTVPTHLVNHDFLAQMPEDLIIFDLASPPGGVDHEAARSLNRKTVWVRGLGASAPVTVGRAQWKTIEVAIKSLRCANKDANAKAH